MSFLNKNGGFSWHNSCRIRTGYILLESIRRVDMKRYFVLILMGIAFCSVADAGHYKFSKPRVEVEGRFGLFYSSLSPYGEWIDCNFGMAWRPYHVTHVWRPYSYGRWVWTSYGWYWLSNEPFGWATYHYGRWNYDDYYGWIWIPDDVWGPSWVEWRYDDDYIGWAPLPPMASFSFNVGITFGSSWVAPVHYWNFVPCRNFTSVRINEYVQPVERTRRFFGHTRGSIDIRAEHDRVVNRGIDVGFVERRGKVRIREIDVVQNDRGTGDRIIRDNNRERVETYRPRLDVRGSGDQVRQPDIRKSDRIPHGELKPGELKPSDRPNRDQINKGVYDRQVPRVPQGEGNDEGANMRSHGNRDLNQKFAIPRRSEAEFDRGATEREQARRGLRENWGQQRQQEQGRDFNARKPQREERTEWKKPEKAQEHQREHERKEQRSAGRGRRP